MLAPCVIAGVVASVVLLLSPAHAASSEPGTLAFQFGSLGLDDGEFNQPHGVAVGHNGNIIVVDYNPYRVQVFHPNGTFASKLTEGFGSAVAVAPNGNIVVGGSTGVRVFHPNGTFAFSFNTERGLYYYADIDVAPNGNIAISYPWRHYVQVFHPNGTFAFQIGSLGEDDGEFENPYDVAFDSYGNIFVADSGNDRVQVFHPNGTFAFVLLDGMHWNLASIAVGPNGEVVVTSNSKLRLYHPNGTLAVEIAARIGGGGFSDADFSPEGMIVGVSNGARRVSVIHGLEPLDVWDPSSLFSRPSSDGSAVLPRMPAPGGSAVLPRMPAPGGDVIGGEFAFGFGSYGEGAGQFMGAHGVAFGPGGIIAVADRGNHRVQVFYANGTFAFELGMPGPALGEFYGPYDVAFGPDGLLAVSEFGNHRVQVFRLQYQ